MEAGPVLVGASSWSARSLVHESTWYPRRSMKAAERMAYYAARFPLVEIDATARFPPTPELARQWVERTPEGFTIDIAAWSLLVGAATLPESLWEDLHHELRPEARDRRRLYATHLSRDGLDEAWARFRHSLGPLHAAGRLGAVLLRYPWWLKPGATARALLADARRRLDDLRLAVELPNPRWLEPAQCETTLALLDDLGLGFVCVDAASAREVVATTSDLAVVRLYGRDPLGTLAYRYTRDELAAWVPKVQELSASGAEVHVLFANAHQDLAVTNAAELAELLGGPCPS